MAILIKRYANRKLYNTQSSRYITLKGIAQLLDEGQEVKVIDNETGEDITSVALSQILVDSKRSNSKTPTSLLSQIMEHGGDALYDAFKRSVDDASDGIGEMQERFRRIVRPEIGREAPPRTSSGNKDKGSRSRFANWIAYASPDLESSIENSVERVFKLLDLPRRRDVEALNENLKRLLGVVENLERTVGSQAGAGAGSLPPTAPPTAEVGNPDADAPQGQPELAPATAARQEPAPIQD